MASLSVYELVHFLKLKLDSDPSIHNCVVTGEISNFHRHSSGHWYFSLKDDHAKIACVMFKTYSSKLQTSFKDGDKVMAKGSVSLFENSGSLQLYISDMKLAGLGDLYQQFELLRQKLFKLGLFNEEHKKGKPLYPEKIAVITGDKSAALSDIKTMFKKRWSLANYIIYPCLVQSDGAAKDIISKLKEVDLLGFDAIILARGGGSIEDLWAFNDEELAYTIYHLSTFIVTGIGHEQDFTIADFVADLRAPTPTGAIEALTPDIFEVKLQIKNDQIRLNKAIHSKVELNLVRLDKLINRPLFLERNYLILDKMQYIDYLLSKLLHFHKNILLNREKIKNFKVRLCKYTLDLKNKTGSDLRNDRKYLLEAFKKEVMIYRARQKHLYDLLVAYDINHILKKGFALVYRDQELVKENDIKQDEILKLRFLASKWSIKTIKKEA